MLKTSQTDPVPALRRHCFLVVILAVLPTHAYGDLVTVPPGLQPGDKYRLVFTTSDPILRYDDIGPYNSLASNAASNVPALNALGATWKAIVSTATTNARVNTDTEASDENTINDAPIYLVDGTKVANGIGGFFSLWSGTLLAPINVTELGGEPPKSGFGPEPVHRWVFTGTSEYGVTINPLVNDPNASINVGDWADSNGEWINLLDSTLGGNLPIYAISSTLMVPVPEPSSLLYVAVVAAFVVGGASKRRQRSRHAPHDGSPHAGA